MSAERDSFVVDGAARIFGALKKASFFFWANKVSQFDYFAVEWWVLGWTALSVASYLWSLFFESYPAVYIVVGVVAALRIFEMVVYQVNVLIFDQYRAGRSYQLRSYIRSFVLLVCNYIETIFWFATLYSIFVRVSWLMLPEPRGLSILRESIGLMVANSTGKFELNSHYGSWIAVTTHAAIGLFMTIVVISRFVSLLPRPRTSEPGESPPATGQ